MEKRKEVWTIATMLTWMKGYFGEKGVENPRLDAEVLLSHVMGKDRLYLYVHFDQPLEETELAALRLAVKKRATRLPVAYIVENKEFMGLDFKVTTDVLIPRPDTEILVETALKLLQTMENPHILDIGTGSGAIAVSVLVNIPSAQGTAVDISPAALVIAEGNANRHQVTERLTFCLGDLFAPVQGQLFNAIISNPPYIPLADIGGLTPEVRQEPSLALAGGEDGLDFYRRIIHEAKNYLAPGGFIALEVGFDQAQLVATMARETGLFKVSDIVKDYGGIERVVILTEK